MNSRALVVLLSAVVAGACLRLDAALPKWNLAALNRAPRTYAVELPCSNEYGRVAGVEPIWIEGESYRGRPTRVFAWWGLPKGASAQRPVPAMVLVHGGGGTAFASWVKLWTERGYAAIAMDTCGKIPQGRRDGKRVQNPHPWSGPVGWDASVLQVDEPVTDQWTYHAVSAILRCHSFLRTRPEVITDKIGLTGISWGGYLTSIAMSVDDRFVFAAPVYGCGWYELGAAWGHVGTRQQYLKWLSLWDPRHYLRTIGRNGVKGRVLWCTGTNDLFYPLDALANSADAVADNGVPLSLSIKLRMPHGHPPAGDPREISVLADNLLRDGKPLVEIRDAEFANGRLSASFCAPGRRVVKAELLSTCDRNPTLSKRLWTAEAIADFDGATGKVSAAVPPAAVMFFVNVTTDDGLVASTRVFERADRLPVGANQSAKYIQRTLKMMEDSTAENPAEITVLFYGQSIMAQGWTRQIVKDFKKRYPTVKFRFDKFSIVGFKADELSRTALTDLYPYYPDLLFFHVHGPLDKYEEIIRTTKQRTTADIVLWSSHLEASQHLDVHCLGSDRRTKSIRAIAGHWNCLFIDLHRKWCDLLKKTNREPKALLKDGVHLNPEGCEQYGRFVTEELVRIPGAGGIPGVSGEITEIPLVSDSVTQRADGGYDIRFTGNRLVAVFDGTGSMDGKGHVLLDGQPVGTIPGTWMTTRPTAWPMWQPAIRHVDFKTAPVEEEWTLTCLEGSDPNGKFVRFRVDGSVTGFDGEGWSTNDFTSVSGRVVIPADDWGWPWQIGYENNRRKRANRPAVSVTPGLKLSWKTRPLHASPFGVLCADERRTLVQGCANAAHVLSVIPASGTKIGFRKFIAYRPVAPVDALVVPGTTPEDCEAYVEYARRFYPTPVWTNYTKSLVDDLQANKKLDAADRPLPGGKIRWRHVDGMRNVRDIGGWNGLPTGRAFRGSEPDCLPIEKVGKAKFHNLNITPAGLKVMREEMKIKTDLDLRAPGESPNPGKSSLGVKLVRAPIAAYLGAFSRTNEYARALRVFVDPANYPIYFHCYGGADRTGTLAFLLEGLCGVNETDLSIDYELTSFASVFGNRTRVGNRHFQFPQLVDRIKSYPGATLSEKIASYMETTLGLTKDEIAAIRRNLSGRGTVGQE